MRDTILDEYELSYEGLTKPILLYVDEYHFSNPLAPAGLRRHRPIRLTQPAKGTDGPAN
jgi:hypothetical protein